MPMNVRMSYKTHYLCINHNGSVNLKKKFPFGERISGSSRQKCVAPVYTYTRSIYANIDANEDNVYSTSSVTLLADTWTVVLCVCISMVIFSVSR